MSKSYGDYNQAYPLPKEEQTATRQYSYDLMSGEDLKKVLSKVEVIVVDAWAPWCQPCKKLSSKFEMLGEKYRDYIHEKRLLLLKDNIDHEDTSYHRNLVEVVPTFFVYVGGELQYVWTGVDFSEVDRFLFQYFQGHPSSLPPKSVHPIPHQDKQPQGQPRHMPQIKQNIRYPPH